VFCNQKSLGNANLVNLMSFVDLGKASPNTERTEYHFCKPCEISQCSFFISYYDQQMHNYFTNDHTPTCFNTIVSSSGSL
jgi:hypothetical protein